MKRLFSACGATVAIVLPLSFWPAADAAAPTTVLRPAAIERGPDPRIPHINGTTVVDGDRRIKVNAGRVELVGKASSTAYVVGASSDDGRNERLLRVTTAGTKVLARGSQVWDAELSADGKRLALVAYSGEGTSTVRVISSSTGAVQYRGGFAHDMFVLEFAGGRVLLSYWNTSGGGRTLWWSPATDTRRTLVGKPAYLADASTDRLAYFTLDPARGGCSEFTKLSSPPSRIWRSCRDRVVAISSDGSRLATDTIIRDGPDSGVRRLRSGTGTLLATFRSEAFGPVQWETNRALLLETHGRTSAATIRCTPSSCNRASKLSPSQAGGV